MLKWLITSLQTSEPMALPYGTFQWLTLSNISGLPWGEGGGDPLSPLLFNQQSPLLLNQHNTERAWWICKARHIWEPLLLKGCEIGYLGARKPLARLFVSGSRQRCGTAEGIPSVRRQPREGGREVARQHLALLFGPREVKLVKPRANEAVCSRGWGGAKPFKWAYKRWHEAVREQFSAEPTRSQVWTSPWKSRLGQFSKSW